MKKSIIVALILAATLGKVQAQNDADPSMTEMVPPPSGVIALNANANLVVKMANLGGSTDIVQNSLRVVVSVGLNTEIIGLAAGSDPRWTIENLTVGNGNAIRLTNSAVGPIPAGEFANIILNVKGKVLGGPLTVVGNVNYIAGVNPIIGVPSASQGDDPLNNSATTSLTVSIPAPLHFGVATVKENNCSGTVSWKTLDEQNVASFDVQQSFDGVNFTTVKNVPSKGNGANSYEAVLEQTQKKMFYRVVATDIDGRKAFGQILSLQLTSCTKASLVKVFPVPASKDQAITMQTNVDEKITYRIIDMSGKTVETGQFSRIKRFALEVSGTYIVEMVAPSFKERQTLVVQ